MQVRYAASHVQHMQKALEQMNVKLAEVVSDITGVTGLSIIDAILGGERNPMELAKRRDERCHHSEALIALALEGTWRPEHLFELRQAPRPVPVPSSADHRVRRAGRRRTGEVRRPGGREDSDR